MKRLSIRKAGVTVILLAVTAILIFGIAPFTLAWIQVESEPKINTFTPGKVTLQINEGFTPGGTTKSNVTFKNTGTVPAFIRVALLPIWRYGTDNSGLTATGTYTMTLNTTDWTLHSDGYYYYNSPVPKDGLTAVLIKSCSPTVNLTTNPEYTGMAFEMQVIASALQADGWNDDTVKATNPAFAAFSAATDNNNKEY